VRGRENFSHMDILVYSLFVVCPASTNYNIKGLPLPRLGGNSNNGDKCGGFARNFNNDASNTNWNRRGRETIFRDKRLMGEDLAATVRNHTMEFYQATASRQKSLLHSQERPDLHRSIPTCNIESERKLDSEK